MKILEEKYWTLIRMLEAVNLKNEIIKECLSMKLTELSFSYSSNDNHRMNKEHVYKIYKTRGTRSSRHGEKNAFVVGYENLLPALEKSDIAFVNVSALTTEKGTFMIFSNYDYQEYIGILKSKSTLTEVRETMAGSPYYQEITFLKGNLIDKSV